MVKIHAVNKSYFTGNIKTHFRTNCGIIRHVFTDLKTTVVFDKITCKNCRKAYNHTKP